MNTPMVEDKLKELKVFTVNDHTFAVLTAFTPVRCGECQRLILPKSTVYRVSRQGRTIKFIHPSCLGRSLGKA
jgi:hypothetical protein